MSLKLKIILASALLLVAFALGRYSVPASSVKETSQQKDTKTEEKTDTHKVTTVVEKPTGEKVTTIVEDTTSHAKTDSSESSHSKESKTSQKLLVNVSALVGFNYRNFNKPSYGISVSREFAGPLTVGLYGMDNGTVGLSLGLNF